MPKARIFTISIENAEPLAEQLRKRGYEVQILRPGDATSGAVDLELELESRPTYSALDRAAQLAREKSADIYVAAGCFPRANPQPVAVELPAIAPSIATEPRFSESLRKQRDAMARALREKRALMRQSRIAQQQSEAEVRLETGGQNQRLQEDVSVPENEPVAAHRLIPEEEITGARALDPRLARQWAQPPSTPSLAPRTRELRLAFAVAAMIAAVFMLGWTAVGRNSNSLVRSPDAGALPLVERQVPASAEMVHSAQLVHSSSAAPKTSAQAKATRSAKPPVSSSQHRRNLRRRKESGDETIAQDEVRYFTRRARTAKQTSNSPQHASLKRYSDIP